MPPAFAFMPETSTFIASTDRLMPEQIRRDLGGRLAALLGERGLGNISLLIPPKDVADDTTKFLVADARSQPALVVICSSPAAADSVARGVRAAAEAAHLLGQVLSGPILKPAAEGELSGLSYAIWPYCRTLSDHPIGRRLQNIRLRRPIFQWLLNATQKTRRRIQAAQLGPAVIEPLSHLASLPALPRVIRAAAQGAIDRVKSGQWRPVHVLMHNDFWRGNILLAPDWKIIDWAGCRAEGYGIYDLLRMAMSLQLGDGALKQEITAHCRALQCDSADAASHLLAALGWLGLHLDHFPFDRFVELVMECFKRLARLGLTPVQPRQAAASDGKYRLLLATLIPVYRKEGRYCTDRLWWRDMQEQLRVVEHLCLVAPLGGRALVELTPIAREVRVVISDQVNETTADELVEDCDVVQVASGAPPWRLRVSLRLAAAAKRAGRCLILSISSNRIRTTLLNAQNLSWPRRLKARWIAWNIQRTQKRMIEMADGVFITGKGLLPQAQGRHRNIHIGTASWIRQSEVLPASKMQAKALAIPGRGFVSLCVAARLERMKGAHLAIEALTMLDGQSSLLPFELTIMGAGPELENLRQQARRAGVSDRVRFAGVFDYPQPFFAEIGKCDLMLVTNLNDEQPRIVFDSASQGVIPVCPDSEPFAALELPEEIYYKRGDAASLAQTIQRLAAPALLTCMIQKLPQIAGRFTIDRMHEDRRRWIAATLAGKAGR